MKLLAILLVAIAAAAVVASDAKHPPNVTVQACGRTLLKTLVKTCEEYKSSNSSDEQDYNRYFHRGKSLVEACCENICPIDEFLTYCIFAKDLNLD